MTMIAEKKFEMAMARALKLYARIRELESPELNKLRQEYHEAISEAVKLQCGIHDG